MTSNSSTEVFESAVEAIVNGDIATLRALLTQDPSLVHARSTREHGSTLLHYVSANGVEGERQKTPPNILEITQLLLETGADINAESEAYGGHSTIVGLTATSCHPEEAGLQLSLLQLLLDRGANIDTNGVNACLANGRGPAAEFLAQHGANLDLEAAAGIGRLDLVRELLPVSTQDQIYDGFSWACEFGRNDVAIFLLGCGVPLNARLRPHRQTALHWAAFGGHADLVALLLERGSDVSLTDDSFHGTPLEWALYAWGNGAKRPGIYEVVARLIRAGATINPEWYEGDPDRERAARKLHADAKMHAALLGQST